MIAKITYEDAELGDVTATLSDSGEWSSDDPAMTATLNAMLPAEDKSPARGDWLGWHAEKMARMLGGTVEVAKKTPPEGDVRY